MPTPSDWFREAPLVIAHRGASYHAPENTMPAFQLALEQGADGIELDAKVTADGHVIALHDPTLERTTDGHGRPGDWTLERLKALDAGAWMGRVFRGTPIPTLEEILESLAGRLLINIELTNYRTPGDGLVERVVDIVRRRGLQGRVLLSSFYRGNLAAAKRLAPEIPVGHLTGPTRLAAIDWLRGSPVTPEAVHVHTSFAMAWAIRRWRGRGRRVLVYTVDRPEAMRRLVRLGVDGIITNNPALARQTVGS